jgi:hypothetical protein
MPMTFPSIEWTGDSEESSSFDCGCATTSSLDEVILRTCNTPTDNTEWWASKLSPHLQKLSMNQQHLHRSMAFFDLKAMVCYCTRHS